MAIVDDIAGLRRILTRSRTIAVVGLSANWYRPSYFAAKYMQDFGYRIIPVNPAYREVLGERCYPDLCSARESADVAIDIVDCFRKSEDIPPIARDAGLDVVMNRCVKIERARLLGGLSWAGVNTGVISARRPA